MLKLCQISNEQYVETADGTILTDTVITPPKKFSVEIINWESESEFNKRGKIISFSEVEVEILSKLPETSIRDEIHKILLEKYPELIK